MTAAATTRNDSDGHVRVAVSLLVALAFTLVCGGGRAAPDTEKGPSARVWVAPEGIRLRRTDIDHPLSHGDNPIWSAEHGVVLEGLRDEVLGLQVIVQSEVDLTNVTVDVTPFQGPSEAAVDVARFVEHYVHVQHRSRNEQEPEASLGWTAQARPSGGRSEGLTGWLPDALIPMAGAASDNASLPREIDVIGGQLQAIWIDLSVDGAALPGAYSAVVRVDGPLSVEIPIALTVVNHTMPYRAVRFHSYYGSYELESRFGGDWQEAERSLWQLMHAHHVELLTDQLLSASAVSRISTYLDGSSFDPQRGYRGPGAGVGATVTALGTYGELKEPSAKGVEAVRGMEGVLRSLPGGGPPDVFVYAVDEQCDSPRGPGWRRLLRADPFLDHVMVGHTCSRPPVTQSVDLVMMTTPFFEPDDAARARRAGQRVWVYNGQLPHAGPLMLDAPITSLLANGWIAAAYDVDRWFLWETTFWNDDNRGGHGPTEVFSDPETFHNADGDTCLYDGLLVYPGRQSGVLPPSAHHPRAGTKFEGRGFESATVFPSLRLKSLRRGIQDAGLIALAHQERPQQTEAIVARMVPRALGEVSVHETTPFGQDGRMYAEARAELRGLIATNDVGREASAPADDALAGVTALDVMRASLAQDRVRNPGRAYLRGGIAAALALFLGVVVWMNSRARKG